LQNENLSFHLEEDSLPTPHGISLADAARVEDGLPRGIIFLREPPGTRQIYQELTELCQIFKLDLKITNELSRLG
jgi:hypothetical protein